MKINYGYTTPTTTVSQTITDLGYGSFALVSNTGDQVVVNNTTSPIDRVEQLKYNIYPIPNIYKGTGINVTSQSPDRTGYRIVANIHETWAPVKETTDVDPAPGYLLPVACQISFSYPNNSLIQGSDIEALLLRTLRTLFDDTKTDATRLNHLMRGALVPSGIS